MVDENLGWAVGGNGTLLKYSQGTGVELSREALDISISPNPARGTVSIVASSNVPVERIEVINIFGQVDDAIEPEIDREGYTLDLTEVHQGIYFLKIYSGSQFVIRRLVVSN
jgi:hypothetical protein